MKHTWIKRCALIGVVSVCMIFSLIGCNPSREDSQNPGQEVTPPDTPSQADPQNPVNPEPEPPLPPVAAVPQVEDIANEILKTQDFPEMIALTPNRIELFYGIDAQVYEQGAVFVCTDTAAYEVAVIKALPNQANVVLQGIEERLISQKDSFEDYMPEQYELLQNALIEMDGEYILFVVADDIASCEKTFHQLLS